ncbi:hypothetical protein TNCV_3292171 [Trichonephila clavipes]|nr:hypothetical protein TNCV_3292171 [Trichonephila clavipes]
MNRSDSERDRLEDDYVADKAYERRIVEGESSSDQSDEKNTCKYLLIKENFGSHPLPSKSLEHVNFIVIAESNSWFQYNQDAISNENPPKTQNGSLKI